jgi:hypothetical protein
MYEQLTCYVHSGGYKREATEAHYLLPTTQPTNMLSIQSTSTQTGCIVFLDLLRLSSKKMQQKTKKHTTGGIPK